MNWLTSAGISIKQAFAFLLQIDDIKLIENKF